MEWYGWTYEKGKWQRVTGPHETLSACSRALTKIGKARRVPDRFQVMTGGGPPRFVPGDKYSHSPK